jgi:thermostable 8-oxoguanine DNA glycosylase
MQTINEIVPSKEDIENAMYSYQTVLTAKLDNLDSNFDQNIVNEIVLWKVNRYANIENETLELINKIKKTDIEIDPELTEQILLKLLSKDQKGFRLAMASTVLRFKNPNIYQIIDQRVYRFIYGQELKYKENDLNEQILIYMNYLNKLRQVCNEYSIDYTMADRVFYSMDKIYNSEEKLNGY